jgi:hypothetical protein
MAQVVRYLSSKYEALSSSPISTKEIKRETEREEKENNF